MNKHMKRLSRTVGTPPITISTTCGKKTPFSVVFSASKSESSISKPSLSVGRTALPPAKSSLPVPPSHMRSPNSWGPKTAVMGSILTLRSETSEHYSTIHKTQRTTWQYTAAHGSLSIIRVVTRRIYRMNNCTQWSSVFTMVLRFKLRV